MIRKAGFTLIEVVIVLFIGGILASLALPMLGGAGGRMAIRGARDDFSGMLATARALAIESGMTVQLHWGAAGDSAWITRNDSILRTINFGERYDVDLSSSGSSPWTLCFSPRGYGNTGCNSFSSGPSVSFSRGADSTSVTVLPLGQLVY